MALIFCPECNKEVSDTAKRCVHCGYKLKKEKHKKKIEKKKKIVKKRIIISFSALMLVGILFCLYYFFSPKTVPWCCNHSTESATCTEPETCKRCGKTFGEAKGHSWRDATCIAPKMCKVCFISEGNPSHDWIPATCESPKKCRQCGLTSGKPNEHEYVQATCTSPMQCKFCNDKKGEALGHNVVDYVCTRCNELIVSKDDVPNILDITSSTYHINSVGGIDQSMTFKNKSSKTINYITVTLQFYNAVGDIIKDDITHKNYVSLRYTGPLKPGKSADGYWEACFYNSTFCGTLNIEEIKIVYDGGQTLILNDSIADNAVTAWRKK